MPMEIPSQFEFEHLLSHTFPGFFSALSLFMLFDVWSYDNLTPLITKDFNNLVAFVGFILLIGTILGVVIDNIHHTIIEDKIFRKSEKIIFWETQIKEYIKYSSSKLDERYVGDFKKVNSTDRINYHYFFNAFGDDAIALNHYIRNAKYCYSEFFSNTFISLIPFSLIIPFYLLKTVHIPWNLNISISILSFILACFCFYSSYDTYDDYYQVLCSIIKGYIDNENNEEETVLKCSIRIGKI